MHYAFPSRKSSDPPPFLPRASRIPFHRRHRGPAIALLAVGLLATLWLLLDLLSGPTGPLRRRIAGAPAGGPPVVLVTVFDAEPPAWQDAVRRNREAYAARHGYATFFTNTSTYDLNGAPASWAKVPTLRHAMTAHPSSAYFFYLGARCLIANPALALETHLMAPDRLAALLLPDRPVVPPDSIITTFAHRRGDRVDLVVTQDGTALAQESFVLRGGEWARFLLDAWFDPLYRGYNFQKAEAHALEHIVQWHGTVLAKLAIVPQRILNSYTAADAALASEDGLYQDSDFIVNFGRCDEKGRRCEEEMAPFLQGS